MDNVIASRELQVERKPLTVEFRESERGLPRRFGEGPHGRLNSTTVPGPGLNNFTAATDEVVIAASTAAPA